LAGLALVAVGLARVALVGVDLVDVGFTTVGFTAVGFAAVGLVRVVVAFAAVDFAGVNPLRFSLADIALAAVGRVGLAAVGVFVPADLVAGVFAGALLIAATRGGAVSAEVVLAAGALLGLDPPAVPFTGVVFVLETGATSLTGVALAKVALPWVALLWTALLWTALLWTALARAALARAALPWADRAGAALPAVVPAMVVFAGPGLPVEIGPGASALAVVVLLGVVDLAATACLAPPWSTAADSAGIDCAAGGRGPPAKPPADKAATADGLTATERSATGEESITANG
jgi:hypothetical protein